MNHIRVTVNGKPIFDKVMDNSVNVDFEKFFSDAEHREKYTVGLFDDEYPQSKPGFLDSLCLSIVSFLLTLVKIAFVGFYGILILFVILLGFCCLISLF